MRRLLKKLSFVVLLLAIVFVPALLVSATGEISVKISMYTAESNPSVSNIERGLGFRQSINPPGGSTFAYFALNGYVSEKLGSDYQFPVRTKTEIDAYYHPAGQYVVIFADSNNKVLDVKYVTSGQTVSVTAANTAAASLVKYGMTLNGESTRWKTSDNVGPEVAITSNRIFYAQYTVTNVDTFALTVNGGTSDKATYAFNEVATLTANADNGSGVPFSHWEDVDGNVLSTKSVYKFTMHKITTVNAVFAASSEYSVPVVNMSDAIVLRADTVSYMGQFDLPDGYTFVESGFLFSRSSMVLEKTSLGVTVAQSNVHNSTTKEYLMTFSNTLFNSIRAYVTVERTSDSAIITYYSENYHREVTQLGEGGTYSTGFETATKGAYAIGTVVENGVVWTLDEALIADDANRVGGKSVRLRGSMYTMSGFSSLTQIDFKAALYASDEANTVVVSVSKDGNTWIDVSDALPNAAIVSTSLVDYTLLISNSATFQASNISSNDILRVKIAVGTPGKRVNIDAIVFTQSAFTGAIHEVVFNNEGVLETALVAHGDNATTPSVTKTGNSLSGWYSDSDKTTLYNLSTPITKSMVLFAGWTPNNYTVTFHYNGADGGEMPSTIVAAYDSYIDLPVPTRTGYDFDGWFNIGITTEYSDPYQIPATNRNMYAGWTINDLGKAIQDVNSISLPNEVSEATTLALPTSGGNGSTISWESSHNAIINSSTGVVLLPEESTTVTLTATATLNGEETSRQIDIFVGESEEPQTASVSLTTSSASGTYPTSYGSASWSFGDITFSGVGLNRNGSSVEYTIQGNSSNSSKITSNQLGVIKSISIRIPNTGSVAATSAKFYIELANNSNFTNSIRYSFGSGYTSNTNIDLSQHSGSVTVATVLSVKDTTTGTPSIVINTSSHNATYVRFVWESGASYYAQIDIEYVVNP